jgi:hypothetical protein
MQIRAVLIIAVVALGVVACATVKPVNPGAPRRDEAPYPVILADAADRIEAARATWAQLSNQSGVVGNPAPPLQPVTDTIRSFPPTGNNSFFLPKVGATSVMSDEETREALRRLLVEWQKLIGANPQQLSLVQEIANADGTKTAVYEQRAFSYPLRGNYGKVEVQFAADRHVLNLSSTSIPDSDRIQAALVNAATRLKNAEDSVAVAGRSFTYNDAAGPHSYTIPPGTQAGPQQLVVYTQLLADQSALEFHLAWEVGLAGGPVKTVYIDAISDQVLSALPSP